MATTQFPENKNAQKAFIHKERLEVIQKLAVASRKLGHVPDATVEPGKSLLPRLDALLFGLGEKVTMDPEIKNETKIHEGLKVIFMHPQYHFPPRHVEEAKALYERWESEYWGGAPPPPPPPAVIVLSTSEDEDNSAPPKRQKKALSDRTVIKLPPKDHPIWGVNGIMHGLARKTNLDKDTKSIVWNTEYPKKDAKVFGSNGITTGTWFPSQLSALFHGAHGNSQGGIAGDPNLGAYSIVVSGLYDNLDQDRGTTVYYSGSGSHDNRDPKRAGESTSGTRALDMSISTGRPVRLLRTSRGQSRYSPAEGIRYDGLYHVVDKMYPRNEKGGMYEQFKLEREDGQTSLDTCKRRPSPQDLSDFERIRNGYPSRR